MARRRLDRKRAYWWRDRRGRWNLDRGTAGRVEVGRTLAPSMARRRTTAFAAKKERRKARVTAALEAGDVRRAQEIQRKTRTGQRRQLQKELGEGWRQKVFGKTSRVPPQLQKGLRQARRKSLSVQSKVFKAERELEEAAEPEKAAIQTRLTELQKQAVTAKAKTQRKLERQREVSGKTPEERQKALEKTTRLKRVRDTKQYREAKARLRRRRKRTTLREGRSEAS